MKFSDTLTLPAGAQWYSWSLEQFLDEYRPGNSDPTWTWNDEYHHLLQQPATVHLINDIRANGFKNPVSIGDGRTIQDGHRRVVAALYLGYKHIPVQLAHGRKPLF